MSNGEKLFRSMYKDTADKVQGLLDDAFPDMGEWADPWRNIDND